jgi:hypothetical protein
MLSTDKLGRKECDAASKTDAKRKEKEKENKSSPN